MNDRISRKAVLENLKAIGNAPIIGALTLADLNREKIHG